MGSPVCVAVSILATNIFRHHLKRQHDLPVVGCEDADECLAGVKGKVAALWWRTCQSKRLRPFSTAKRRPVRPWHRI